MVVPVQLVDLETGLFLFPTRISLVGRVAADRQTSRERARQSLGHEQQLLVEQYFEVAVRMASSILRSWRFKIREDELRSLVGVALCQAANRFEKRHQVKFTTFLFTYLKGALSREMSGCFRRKNRFTSEESLAELEADEATCPHRSIEGRQLSVKLRRVVEGLPAQEREILEKHFGEGMSISDVARNLGYSRGHISRLKSDLLDYLGEQLRLN